VISTVGKRTGRELAQAIVQAIDRLHCSRRIEKGTVRERSLCDVHKHSQAIRDVLIKRSLGTELDGTQRGVGVDSFARAFDLE
jgi:hypothetical protein